MYPKRIPNDHTCGSDVKCVRGKNIFLPFNLNYPSIFIKMPSEKNLFQICRKWLVITGNVNKSKKLLVFSPRL